MCGHECGSAHPNVSLFAASEVPRLSQTVKAEEASPKTNLLKPVAPCAWNFTPERGHEGSTLELARTTTWRTRTVHESF